MSTEESLTLTNAIDLMKFYEESAQKAKDRVWTIVSWLLSLNVGIIGFCLQASPYPANTLPFFLGELVACLAGICLCFYLKMFIRDQGQHISNHWRRAKNVRALHASLQQIIEVKDEQVDGEDFPRFCTRLLVLSNLFIIAFVAIFILMAGLRILYS